MRRIRPTKSRDGVRRMEIPVFHRLTRDEVLKIFLHHVATFGADATVNYGNARMVIAKELQNYGSDLLEPVEDAEEPDEDDVKWAEEMTEILWPVTVVW